MKEFNCKGCEHKSYSCKKGECNFPIEEKRITRNSSDKNTNSAEKLRVVLGFNKGKNRPILI